MGRADGTAARGDGRVLRRFAGRPGSGRRGSESGNRSGCPRAISSPWARGSSARSAILFVARKRRANAWRPWRWIPRFASGRRRIGRLSATNSPRPSRNWLRSTTMNPPPADARIAWWSWRTLCRRNPIPRSHHEREERSLRTPFSPGRSRGPRHAGGSLAGHRHRAGDFVLVRADRVRGARREAGCGDVELRPGHGVAFRRDGLGSAAEVCRQGEGWGGSPPIADEWSVEARGGGICVVRVVHSLFASTDDWDNQLEGTESGWPGFFRILRIYLTHFRGQRSAMMQWMAPAAGTEAEAWDSADRGVGAERRQRRAALDRPGGGPSAWWRGGARQPESVKPRCFGSTSRGRALPPWARSTSAARSWSR